MNPSWIGAAIGLVSLLAGAITHFMYVRVEIEKLKLMVNLHNKAINKIDDHLPEIHEKVNSMNSLLVELRVKMDRS